MWLGPILACTPDSAPRSPAAEAPVYVAEVDEPQPLLDAAGVEVALDEALAWFGALDPAPLFAAWSAAAAHADGVCPYYVPGWEEAFGHWYWYDSCATADGSAFDGSLTGVVYPPFADESWRYWDYGWFSGDADVLLPDAQELRFSGSLYAYEEQDLAETTVASYLSWIGDASWLGADYGDTWLGDAPSVDVVLDTIRTADQSLLNAEGGASNLPGTFAAIDFDDVHVDTLLCPDEPVGTVRVADRRGEWYAILFQGEAACDGCGEVWFRGEALGSVCPDLSTLLARAVAP